jgi:excisionase family DNA binding protein
MCDEALLLLKVTAAAAKLSMGRSVMYRYIQTGALRSVKIGGARRILVSDLRDFVRRLSEEAERDER